MFTNKKREDINTFVCAVSLIVETPKASIKDREPLIPIISFSIVVYCFVGQPFPKQLYIQLIKTHLNYALSSLLHSGVVQNDPATLIAEK